MQCENCQPFFVGNARNGGTCSSCSTLCNNHTDICVSRGEQQAIDRTPTLQNLSNVCCECLLLADALFSVCTGSVCH